MLLDVTEVKALNSFVLILKFQNGERRRFNMAPYIDQKPWVRLKSGKAFLSAFVDNGTVVWPGNIDIDPETLYDCSEPLIDEGGPALGAAVNGQQAAVPGTL